MRRQLNPRSTACSARRCTSRAHCKLQCKVSYDQRTAEDEGRTRKYDSGRYAMASLMDGVEARGRRSLASAVRSPRVHRESLADESPCISGYMLQSDTSRCRGRCLRWPCELLKTMRACSWLGLGVLALTVLEKMRSKQVDGDHWTRDTCENRTKDGFTSVFGSPPSSENDLRDSC